jgi:hypothetical protein
MVGRPRCSRRVVTFVHEVPIDTMSAALGGLPGSRASAELREVHGARNRVELDVRRSRHHGGDRLHEQRYVGCAEVPLERLLALPLLDEHEPILVRGVPSSARDALATSSPMRTSSSRRSASVVTLPTTTIISRSSPRLPDASPRRARPAKPTPLFRRAAPSRPTRPARSPRVARRSSPAATRARSPRASPPSRVVPATRCRRRACARSHARDRPESVAVHRSRRGSPRHRRPPSR